MDAPRTTRRGALAGAGATACAAFAAPRLARAQPAATALRVVVFPGVSNLPLFAAEALGAFARRGVAPEVTNTPNSGALRDGVAAGRFHLAHSGVDNAVAAAEAGADAVVLCGGDGGANALYAQPGVREAADLRGRVVLVDAPDTAYALLLYKMLAGAGVPRGAYEVRPVGGGPARLEAMTRGGTDAAACMLNPPQSVQAEDAGLLRLGTAREAVGLYVGTAAWALRPWARENGDAVARYLAAYVEGMRWSLDPANAAAATALLSGRLRLTPEVARRSLAAMTDADGGGFAADARLDEAGFRNVLAIRAEVLGTWGGTPPPPARYLDLSHHERALAALG